MFVGVSLKAYFGHRRTLEWCDQVASIARTDRAATHGRTELAVLPGFTSLVEAIAVLEPAGVAVGAQDLFWEDSGAFTGEVTGAELAELGCRFVEVGHAERRRIFGETDEIVALKVAAAFRNGITPILCIGETERMPSTDAADVCLAQLDAVLGEGEARVVVAYEPVWAIGAAQPAPIAHIEGVCTSIAGWLDARGRRSSQVIYGGSAGPGLLAALGGSVDGLFLGRSAHDPEALRRVLAEVASLQDAPGVPR